MFYKNILEMLDLARNHTYKILPIDNVINRSFGFVSTVTDETWEITLTDAKNSISKIEGDYDYLQSIKQYFQTIDGRKTLTEELNDGK